MHDRPPNPSFSTLVQKFFIEHLQQHREVSSRTVAAYKDTFRLLLSFAEKHVGKPPTRFALTDLDAKLILRFLDYLQRERKNGSRTRNARLAAIRSFLKYAARHDVSAAQVIEHALAVPMKRFDKPLIGFLSREEMKAILEAPDATTWLGQRDRVMLATLYNTGARVSEIAALRVGDVILSSSPRVHINGKGRKQRSVPLWQTTASLLRNLTRRLPRTEDGDPLFPTRAGTRMSRSNITERLSLAVAAASKNQPQLRQRPISPHTIRHTTAMHLLQSGVDITVIALWLGHESPSTTHMYIEADISMKERALNRLKAPSTKIGRYKPPHELLKFLSDL